jgi:hypothetical protein
MGWRQALAGGLGYIGQLNVMPFALFTVKL